MFELDTIPFERKKLHIASFPSLREKLTMTCVKFAIRQQTYRLHIIMFPSILFVIYHLDLYITTFSAIECHLQKDFSFSVNCNIFLLKQQ